MDTIAIIITIAAVVTFLIVLGFALVKMIKVDNKVRAKNERKDRESYQRREDARIESYRQYVAGLQAQAQAAGEPSTGTGQSGDYQSQDI
jgi:hypothetical protein